jgi:hypothetical protein
MVVANVLLAGEPFRGVFSVVRHHCGRGVWVDFIASANYKRTVLGRSS